MEASQRVWRWASGMLGAVCAALVALSFLLPTNNEPVAPPPDSADEVVAASRSGPVGPAAHMAGPAGRQDANPGAQAAKLQTDSAQGSSRATSNLHAKRTLPREPEPSHTRPDRQKVAGRSEDESPETAPKRHTEQKPQIVQPLGYVETADGQRKAIIGEGQSVQLVTEGQRLADNSRVVRVTPTSVEIIPASETHAVLVPTVPRLPEAARAAAAAAPEEPSSQLVTKDLTDAGDEDSPAAVAASPRGTSSAQVAAANAPQPLPHEVEAEASLAMSWRVPPAEPETRLEQPRKPTPTAPPLEAALPASAPYEGAGSPKPLGFVQKADGTTLTVMSDGDSVRLEEQPLVATITPTALTAGFPHKMSEGLPEAPSRLTSPPSFSRGPGVGIGSVATLKALGYVKRANGRLQAILDAGDSVQLVEEGQILADGSRVWGVTPTSVEVAYAPRESPGGPAAREQELLAAARPRMLSRLRAPPAEARMAASNPVPKARGMPAIGAHAAYSRPPPERKARDWIEERSRGQPVEKAKPASTTLRSLPASTQDEAFRTSSVRGEGVVCLRDGDRRCPGLPERHTIQPLGFVEWRGGRLQAIVSNGDGVELLEEGQILADGYRVVAVSPDAVALSPSLMPSSDGQGTSPERVGAPEESRRAAVGTDVRAPAKNVDFSPAPLRIGVPAMAGLPGSAPGIDLGQIEGNGLQKKWPLRDNRSGSRE